MDREIYQVVSEMDGKPFKVGRFAHTLRMRLMREHLGVDVDAMYEEDLMSHKPEKSEMDMETWDPDHEQRQGVEHATEAGKDKRRTAFKEMRGELKDGAEQGDMIRILFFANIKLMSFKQFT